MTEEARAARNAYLRKWAKDHPDKIREYARRHWQKVADAMTEKDRKEEAHEQEADRS